MHYYVGLMSGTSLDGIDAVIVDFSEEKPRLIASDFSPYSNLFRQRLAGLCLPGDNEIERLGRLDRELGACFAGSVLRLLAQSRLSKSVIRAIGCHGQNVRHTPQGTWPYTLQIGDPNTLSQLTGLTVVSDFRRADIALGGQGAPLAPAFHHAVFSDEIDTSVVLNIGGIANITILDPKKEVIGFDTGPGNRLLDDWIAFCCNKPFDQNGDFAKSGKVSHDLLATLLADPYFSLPFPKSTGREYFNLNWLQEKLKPFNLKPEDVQATLIALTAKSIQEAIDQTAPHAKQVIVCGGGVHNHTLTSCLENRLKPKPLVSSRAFGVDPDWVEAIAFAWLAKQTLEKKPGNLPSVTGARKPVILGGVWQCTN